MEVRREVYDLFCLVRENWCITKQVIISLTHPVFLSKTLFVFLATWGPTTMYGLNCKTVFGINRMT